MIGMEETFLFKHQEKEHKEEIFTTLFQNLFLKMTAIAPQEELMTLSSQTILYFQRLMETDIVVKSHSI